MKIGGDLVGGGGEYSGTVYADASSYTINGIGPVTVSGNIVGGTGEYSGTVYVDEGAIASVKIGGSVVGGAGEYSAFIYAGGEYRDQRPLVMIWQGAQVMKAEWSTLRDMTAQATAGL